MSTCCCARRPSRWGKRVYVLAADYNYGQILGAVESAGAPAPWAGEVVGEEFFPLDVNQFGATISRIQAAAPDVVLNVFVGPAHEAFYGQWASAGMHRRIPMMSTTFGGTSEIVRMPPEVVNGIMVIGSYYESLDDPFNQAWLAEFRRRNGTGYGYLTDVPVKGLVRLDAVGGRRPAGRHHRPGRGRRGAGERDRPSRAPAGSR